MSHSVCGFFFSSRRRHTRLQGDWSSDVCSSDLQTGYVGVERQPRAQLIRPAAGTRLLPPSVSRGPRNPVLGRDRKCAVHQPRQRERSEEHTSELQSPCNLVCRLLLEKKKSLSAQ